MENQDSHFSGKVWNKQLLNLSRKRYCFSYFAW